MTVDERIERLTERHEALAQTVELLAAQGRSLDKKIEVVVLAIRDLVGVVRSHETRIAGIEEGL